MVDLALLVTSAHRLAHLLNAAPPSEERVRAVVEKVVSEKEAIQGVQLGLLTQDEATSLMLAHFHTALFEGETRDPTAQSWNDALLRANIRRALFGS